MTTQLCWHCHGNGKITYYGDFGSGSHPCPACKEREEWAKERQFLFGSSVANRTCINHTDDERERAGSRCPVCDYLEIKLLTPANTQLDRIERAIVAASFTNENPHVTIANIEGILQ